MSAAKKRKYSCKTVDDDETWNRLMKILHHPLERELQTLIEINKGIIVILQNLIANVNTFQNDCKIARTTGVAIDGTGTVLGISTWVAALLLAIPMAGASLTVATGWTMVESVAGTEIANDIMTNNILKHLENLKPERAQNSIKIYDKLLKLNRAIQKIMGIIHDETAAIYFILKRLKSNEISLENMEDYINTLTVEIDLDRIAARVKLKNAICKDPYALKIGLEVTEKGGKSLRSLLENVSLNDGAAATGSLAITRNVLRGLGVGLGVVLTVKDIVSLVKGWNETHTAVIPEITKIKEAYEADVEKCQVVLHMFQNI